MPESLEPFIARLPEYGLRILGVLFALWLSFRISAILQKGIIHALKKRNFDATLSIFFGSLARWLLLTAAVVACLSIFGIETTSFAAILGAAGLAIGLAFQGTLSNFAAGVLILVFRPFKVGDFIDAGGTKGTVVEVGLFVCTLDAPDNHRIVIPNRKVTDGVIENFSFHEKRIVDIEVSCAYQADIDQTRSILEETARSIPGRDEELGHTIILTGMADVSVTWKVRVWCDAANFGMTREATIRSVKQALDQAGISAPASKVDVHLIRESLQAPRLK